VVEASALGKIHSVRMASFRNTIDQVLGITNVKGPSLVTSTGGRYALEMTPKHRICRMPLGCSPPSP